MPVTIRIVTGAFFDPSIRLVKICMLPNGSKLNKLYYRLVTLLSKELIIFVFSSVRRFKD